MTDGRTSSYVHVISIRNTDGYYTQTILFQIYIKVSKSLANKNRIALNQSAILFLLILRYAEVFFLNYIIGSFVCISRHKYSTSIGDRTHYYRELILKQYISLKDTQDAATLNTHS